MDTKLENKSVVDEALKNRKDSHYGIYHDVGVALENIPTLELYEYYVKNYGEASIRDYIEEQIINAEICKEKETAYEWLEKEM